MHKILQSTAALLIFSLITLFSQSAQADICEETYFQCKVGGKEVKLCGANLGDTFNIFFNIGKEAVAEFNVSDKMSVTDHSVGKATLSSIHFKSKGNIYAITICEGMECNPDKSTWISVVKAKKRVKGSGFCEAGTSTGFTNLPFTTDKKGNRVLDKKNFLAEYFLINKNPKDSFLTENIGWSE
jgi:hypothetical protein